MVQFLPSCTAAAPRCTPRTATGGLHLHTVHCRLPLLAPEFYSRRTGWREPGKRRPQVVVCGRPPGTSAEFWASRPERRLSLTGLLPSPVTGPRCTTDRYPPMFSTSPQVKQSTVWPLASSQDQDLDPPLGRLGLHALLQHEEWTLEQWKKVHVV